MISWKVIIRKLNKQGLLQLFIGQNDGVLKGMRWGEETILIRDFFETYLKQIEPSDASRLLDDNSFSLSKIGWHGDYDVLKKPFIKYFISDF